MTTKYFTFVTKDREDVHRALYSKKHGVAQSFLVDGQSYMLHVQRVEGSIHETLSGPTTGGIQIVGILDVEERNSYVNGNDCWEYYDKLLRHRVPDVTFVLTERHFLSVNTLRDHWLAGTPTTFVTPQYGPVHGYVLAINIRGSIDGAQEFEVKMRPTAPAPTSFTYEKLNYLDGNEAILPRKKERTMKVYEALVLKVDDKGEVTEIVKVVAPFVAKNAIEAATIVRVDYAQEHSLNGKDASALQVRVREFCGS